MDADSRLAEEHTAYCQSALNHLDAATQAAVDASNHSRQVEGQAAVEHWKAAVGQGRTALQVSLYILQHGTSTPALFQACHLLAQALPNALSERSLSTEDCWNLRIELFKLASTWADRDQLILRQICYLIAFSTFLGVASCDQHNEQEKRATAASTLQLVSSNIPIGLVITTQLCDHFDTYDTTGQIKRLPPGLTWTCCAAARTYFINYLFGDLLNFACASISNGPALVGLKALRSLICLELDVDLDKIPGVFAPSQRDAGLEEEGIVTPIQLPVHLEQQVLNQDILNLLVESYFRLLAMGDSSEAALFECYTCLATICRSKQQSSDQTQWRSTISQAIILLAQPLLQSPDRMPLHYSAHIIGILQAHLFATSPLSLASIPAEDLRQQLEILEKATMHIAQQTTGLDLDEDRLSCLTDACSVYTQLLELSTSDSVAHLPQMVAFASVLQASMFTVVKSWLEMQMATIEHDDGPSERHEHDIDQQLYGTFLQSFALLCRSSAESSLPLLYHLVTNAYSRVSNAPEEKSALRYHSQLKWIMLVLGYTLTDGADGECPVVPPALEDLALDVIEGPLLIKLPIDLFNILSWMSRCSATDTHAHTISVVLWVTGRWASTYLLSDTATSGSTGYFSEEANGQDALQSILRSYQAVLQTWPDRNDVAKQMAVTLSTMSLSSTLLKAMLQDEAWDSLMMLVLEAAHPVEELHDVVLRLAISSGSDAKAKRLRSLAFGSLSGDLENLRNLKTPAGLTNQQRHYVVFVVKMFSSLAFHAEPQSAPEILTACSAAATASLSIAQNCSPTEVLYAEILDLLQNTLLLMTGGLLEESPEQLQKASQLKKSIIDLASSRYPATRLFPDDGYVHEMLCGLFDTAASAASGIPVELCAYLAQAILPRIDPALLHYSALSEALLRWLDGICWHHPRLLLAPLSASKHVAELLAAVYALLLRRSEEETLQQHLDSCRMLAAVYDGLQRPLRHVDLPLQAIQVQLLHTLAYDPISTTILSSYLQTTRAIFRALDKCGGQPLQVQVLDTFVSSSSAKPYVVEGVRQLWEVMMEGEAFAGRLPKEVEEQAMTTLRVLRL